MSYISAHLSNICSSAELPDQTTCSPCTFSHCISHEKVSGCRACLHGNCNRDPVKLCRPADNLGWLCHLIHIWTATHKCCAGSIQYVPLTWVPPIVRIATPECVLGPHAQDSKAVKCQAKPVKPLGRTSKRKTHRMRCSLARKARPTPNTQRAGTRVPQETGGRASNFPAPPIELIQPRAQAAGRWQNQGLTDSQLLQGILPKMVACSRCLESPTNGCFMVPLQPCAQDLLPRSLVCIA